MPKNVGILTFISRINTAWELLKSKTNLYFSACLCFYEQLNFMAWKKRFIASSSNFAFSYFVFGLKNIIFDNLHTIHYNVLYEYIVEVGPDIGP